MLENTPVASSFQWYPSYYPEKLRKPEGIPRNRKKGVKIWRDRTVIKVQKQQIYVIHGGMILRTS